MMMAGMGLTACDYFSDDSLKPCEYRLHFVYDYNMKFADAFQHEVERATLFICDNKGNYIMQQDFNGNALKANNIKLDLEPGTYYTVTWAGLSEQSYSMPELTPGTTTLQDLRLRTLREADATQRDELSPLWHSLDTLVITRDKHEDKTISLAKTQTNCASSYRTPTATAWTYAISLSRSRQTTDIWTTTTACSKTL